MTSFTESVPCWVPLFHIRFHSCGDGSGGQAADDVAVLTGR